MLNEKKIAQPEKFCDICTAPIEQEVLIARPSQPVCRACGNEIEAVQAERRALAARKAVKN